MKIKLPAAFLIFFFILETEVFAQKENNIWYFGYLAGLNFNSGSPVALTDGAMYADEGCSAICNSNGDLLFYTNGLSVWDSSHTVMPNGDSLAGNYSSSQAALIVPFPGNSSLYYIFTTPDASSACAGSSAYSVVDMSLNNGKGDITIKNNLLSSLSAEKLTATRHSNGNDFWVMVHGCNNNSFKAYQITSSGILSPVISNIGVNFQGSAGSMGYMKFSPDGTKLACAMYVYNWIMLFDFNSTTGILSNEKDLMLVDSSQTYGVEFSQTGNYLYGSVTTMDSSGFGGFNALFQWDISSNIDSIMNASRQIMLPGIPNFAYSIDALQLGPDGKIYVAEVGEDSLGTIENPDLPGALCNFNLRTISLNGKHSTMGLPNYITSYFLPTGHSNNFQSKPSGFTIYPNPADELIVINHSLPGKENFEITITDITGKKLFNSIFNIQYSTFNINVSSLSPGIYFIKEGKEVRKFVMQ